MIDVFFIQYDELNKKNNFQILQEQVPEAILVSNISGIKNAYAYACELSTSQYFFIVDGDNEVLPTFNRSWIESYHLKPTIFWSSNTFGIEYGHGAIKLLHKSQFLNLPSRPYLDFTDVLFKGHFHTDPTVLSIHNLGEGFQRWRSIFREITKLTLRQNPVLEKWLMFDEVRNIHMRCLEFIKERSPRQIFAHLNDYDLLHKMFIDSNMKNHERRPGTILSQ